MVTAKLKKLLYSSTRAPIGACIEILLIQQQLNYIRSIGLTRVDSPPPPEGDGIYILSSA